MRVDGGRRPARPRVLRTAAPPRRGPARPAPPAVAAGPRAGEAARPAWAPPPSARIVASGVPTGTSCPSATSCAPITPVAKHSTSITPLSVSTAATMSPRWTLSPGARYHCASVPAAMSAPSMGMTNVAVTAPPPRPARRPGRVPRSAARPPRGAPGTASAPRRCRRAPPAHRARRTPLHDARADLGREAARQPALVDDDGAVRAPHRGEDALDVERPQAAQVEHLGLDALVGEQRRGLERAVERPAEGDQRDVAPGPGHAGAPEVGRAGRRDRSRPRPDSAPSARR